MNRQRGRPRKWMGYTYRSIMEPVEYSKEWEDAEKLAEKQDRPLHMLVTEALHLYLIVQFLLGDTE